MVRLGCRSDRNYCKSLEKIPEFSPNLPCCPCKRYRQRWLSLGTKLADSDDSNDRPALRRPRKGGHRACPETVSKGENRMCKTGFGRTLAIGATALAGAFIVQAWQPAEAQRKSIRWATSSVDSYGYKVAASMTKMVEEALGGEYTVTGQSLSVDHRRHEGGDGWQRRDRLHGRHRHDASSTTAKAGSRTTRPAKAKLVHTWYAYPMESFMAVPAEKAAQYQVLEGLQRQAGVLHAGRLHELAELPAHLQDARLRLQARPDRSQDAVRRAAGRHDRRLGRLHGLRPLARALLEGDRGAHGRQGHQSVPGRGRKAEGGGPLRRAGRSEERVQQGRRRQGNPGRADPVRLQRPCRSCRRTSSTRC